MGCMSVGWTEDLGGSGLGGRYSVLNRQAGQIGIL